jgi:hypothetical protein
MHFRRFIGFAATGTALVVSGCSGNPQSSLTMATPTSLTVSADAAPAAKYTCGGNPGVHVIPCPAKLEPRRSHRHVYVYGSSITYVQVKEAPNRVCDHDTICTIRQVTTDAEAIRISAGHTCGKAEIVIEAFDSEHHLVGDANLEVVNQDTAVCAKNADAEALN